MTLITSASEASPITQLGAFDQEGDPDEFSPMTFEEALDVLAFTEAPRRVIT